ncbi:hypothetical protein [Phascolarctobacterium sp.]|uniref:hypothetical protein n=1 Tax=Phascolarctobacterium sp. TaxID=2049039 RepID=UPI00386C0342
MKLGIIGARSVMENIIKVIDEEIKDIDVISVATEKIEETPSKVRELEKKVDAVLFTGPYNYHYALKHLSKSQVPWTCIPHNRVSALQSLLQASISLHSDLRHISLDTYDPQIIQEALHTVGIQNAEIYTDAINPESATLNEDLYQAHSRRYKNNNKVICLTSHQVCHELLTKAEIPCIRIFPAKEIIKEQVYYLRLQHLDASDQQGDYAVIAIHYNYVFDNEKDPAVRDWEKLRYQHEIREYVYTIAHKLQAAVFSDDIVPLFIVTSRKMLENVFFKQQDHIKLLQFGQQLQRFRVCLGIGLGDSMLEAKAHSTMALNHAFRDADIHAYIAKSNTEAAAPAVSVGRKEESSLETIARHCGFTITTLQKLSSALVATGNPTTAESLAQEMQMTVRSVNRILSRLEDIGCVQIVAKEGHGKGRPTRIMKILL